MKLIKRTLGLFVALCIIVANIPIVSFAASYFTTTPTGYTSASDVDYVTDGKYIANWGARGEVATFLSSKAQSFYTGSYTFDSLNSYQGGTSESTAPDSSLYNQLYKLMSSKHSYVTSYDANKNLMKYTDCINGDYSKLSTFYSHELINSNWVSGGATWNREHTWPNSKGDASGSGENDIMMLRPESPKNNSSRGNAAYGTGSGYYDPNEFGANLHGDCARIILYQFVRWQCTNTGSEYNPNGIFGTKGVMQSLDVLLEWMEEDPVDTWEMGRNDAVQSITGTRNVFVDYPEFAFKLFGRSIPEDMSTPSNSDGSASCSHKYTQTITPPTCTEAGYVTYTCSLCFRTYTEEYAAATGHKTTVTNIVEATCTASGTQTSTCSSCKQTFTEKINALGHNYVVDKVIDSTETEQGYTIYKCTRCDATYNSDYTSVVGSVVFEFGENGSASHSDGSTIGSSKEYTVDGITLSITNASAVYAGRDATGKSALKLGTGSNIGSFKFAVPEGITKVIIMAAQYKANTSVLTVNGKSYTLTTASNDGKYTSIEIDTTEIKEISVSTSTSGKRAMIDSISFISGCLHAYDNACDSSCNLCGATRDADHSYTETNKTAATCTQDGSVTYVCSVCSDSYTEAVKALGHDYKDTVVAPTETAQGYTLHTCTRCGDSYKDSFTDYVPDTPDTPDTPDGDSVTFECGADGDAAHKENSTAKTTYSETVGDYTLSITGGTKMYLSATDAKGNGCIKLGSSSAVGGFSFTVPDEVVKVIIKVAKYKANTSKLSVNGTAYTLTKNSNDGQYDEIEVDTTSTKTVSVTTVTGGVRAMVNSITYVFEKVGCAHEYDNDCDADCNLCGEVRETSHKYESNVTAPTCTAKGYTTHTCTVCGDSYTDSETDMIAHDYKSEVTAPTCTAKGYTTHTCSVCGDSYTDSETDMIAHSYGEGVVTPPTATAQGYTTYTCTVCQYSYKDNFTPATGEPETLYNLQLTETDEYIKVTWDAVANATKYNLIVKNEENVTLYTRALAADATSAYLTWRNGDVEWDKTYKVTLQPRTSKWLTASSLFGSLKVGNRIVDVKTESVGRTIKVTWRAYDKATQYYVHVYEKGATKAFTSVKATTNEAYVVNAINPEVDYIVKVLATKGTPSMPAANALAIPARLNVFTPNGFWSRGLAPNRAAVSWDEVRGTYKYWAYLTPVNGGETLTRESKKAIANFTGLTPNTEYQVKMRLSIIDADGNTHYSETATLGTFTTPGWEDISFTSVATEAGAELSWKAQTNASSYIIYRATNGTSFKKLATITDPSKLSYVDATAKNGYAYAIVIKVKDDQVSTQSPMIKLAPIVK